MRYFSLCKYLDRRLTCQSDALLRKGGHVREGPQSERPGSREWAAQMRQCSMPFVQRNTPCDLQSPMAAVLLLRNTKRGKGHCGRGLGHD